jgi:flagellar basal body-associated protein FliL
VAVVLVLALGAGGIFLWMRPATPTSAAENHVGVGSTVALETFIVNLTGAGDRAYLRVGITLQLSRPPARNKEEIPVALVRDTILSVLSTARADQLLQPDGKHQLKTEILQALKDRAPQLGVEDVYFTEFLVQM